MPQSAALYPTSKVSKMLFIVGSFMLHPTYNPPTSVASVTVNMSLEASKLVDKTFNFLT